MTRVPHKVPDLAGAAAETNVFRALANSPQVTKGVADLGYRLLVRGSVPARLRELTILRIAGILGSDYEWGQHVLAARAVGVDDDEIRRVREGDLTSFSSAEAAALRYAEAVEARTVTDDCYAATGTHFSADQMVELTVLAGYYGMVARTLLALDVDMDDGVKGLESP